MAKNRTSRRATRGPEWAIGVRFPNGSFSFYFETGETDRAGQPLEHWGRESQARRFESADEAHQVVAKWLRSAPTPPVKYEVIHIQPNR